MKKFDESMLPPDTFCSESHLGPTPNGGAYSTAIYSNKWHEPCRKEEACYVEISEFDSDGVRVGGVYGMCGDTSFTKEEKDYARRVAAAYKEILEGRSRLLTLHKYKLPTMEFKELEAMHWKTERAL